MKFINAINPFYWVNRAIDKRILKYSRGVGSEMKYNPLLVTSGNNKNDKYFTRRMLENDIWYRGNEQDLAYFYQTEAPKFYRKNQPSESMNYFWAQYDPRFRKLHTGYPQLISEKMVDLITSNGYEIKVDGKEQDKLQDMLDDILQDNKFDSALFGNSIETESFSGGATWKLSFNPNISEQPIIELWQPENYTCVVISGRIVEDIFYIYYEKDDNKYRLSEIYGVGKKGAYIDYKLDMLVYTQHCPEGEWKQCPLNELEQTQDLKAIIFEGYYKKLSLYKPNKLPNSEFRNSYLGESDYSGSYGAFDSLDEIASTWIQEFRDGKLNRYFPEELLPTSVEGKKTFANGLKKDHVFFSDTPSDNADKMKIQYEQGEVRVDKHLESFKTWLQIVLNNAGLSPMTVGITGLESIDASAESQQEREKVSIRTRNKKIELWIEFLQDILHRALDLKIMMDSKKKLEKDEKFVVTSMPEYEINVTFNDYIIKSKKDRTTEVETSKGVVYDTLEAVRYVHDEMTEKEQLALSGRIKLENDEVESITQAEYSAMLSCENELLDKLKEMGIELVGVPEEYSTPNTNDFDPLTDGEE